MDNMVSLIISVLCVPLAGSVLLYIFGKRFTAMTAGIIALIFSCVGTVLSAMLVMGSAFGRPVLVLVMPDWILLNLYKVNLTLFCDGLSSLVLLVTYAVSSVAILYSIGYFKEQEDFDARSFYSLVLLFMAGVIGVVISGNLFLFYVFWEMMLLPSYGFVAYFGEDKERSKAIAMRYFIYTHVGAVLILLGILILFAKTGQSDIVVLQRAVFSMDPNLLKAVALLFIVGLSVKMAIWPFHSWLPDTYANAPMPATILLSAVMMNAPIYAFIRFFFSLFPLQIISQFVLLILVFAIISQFYGAALAYVENNIKRIIAYSSISQMGYVLFGIGSLSLIGVTGATFHIINHAIIKALLFMNVGAIFLVSKTYDTGKLGGLAKKMPLLALTGTVGALAIAGVPLFGAFQSEWLIFAGGLKSAYPVLGAIAVIGVVFTAAYALRFVARVFFGEAVQVKENKIPVAMTVSMLILSISTLLIGVFPWYVGGFAQLAIRILGVR